MTPDQFDALAALLRLRAGPASAAARLVLVEKFSVADAAAAQNIPYALAYKAVQRALRGADLAQKTVFPKRFA